MFVWSSPAGSYSSVPSNPCPSRSLPAASGYLPCPTSLVAQARRPMPADQRERDHAQPNPSPPPPRHRAPKKTANTTAEATSTARETAQSAASANAAQKIELKRSINNVADACEQHNAVPESSCSACRCLLHPRDAPPGPPLPSRQSSATATLDAIQLKSVCSGSLIAV